MSVTRPTLGPMVDAVCFQYLRFHAEDVVGRVPIVAAGRRRGYDVIVEKGLVGVPADGEKLTEVLDGVLGLGGTRLCLVRSVEPVGGGFEVRISEGACTMGRESDEPVCAYTLGVFMGAMQAITGAPMRGEEAQCEAMGAAECVYLIRPVV
ncbi:MAG: 4-vinyl reductase [Kineosporiaceae bacterium]